jgi:glycosyltransferase involved in cell wall biosynthesis
VGGNPELIRSDELGLLYPEGDETRFVNLLMSLADDPVRRKRMGEKAREFAQNEFSFKQVISQLQTLYERLLDDSRRS